jgi:hypothetical protein
MVELTARDGVTAICNFAPDDPSRVIKAWLCDWHLVYRNEIGLRSLFPPTTSRIDIETSPDGSLIDASSQDW